MKAILPVAGIGTRLRPLTYTTPKVLLTVAGKPMIGYILDKLQEIEIKDIVLIIGENQERIKEYIEKNYNFHCSYVFQKQPLGLGHAVYLTKEKVGKEPALIIYGDTIFSADIPVNVTKDGTIGVKEIEDPRRFGIVEVKGDRVVKLVEKPEHPTSKLAIVGVNVINNTQLLFESLEEIIKKDIKTKGEYQLTDALQLMIEKNAYFTTFQIEEWYDCGKPETLLSTNKILLSKAKSIPRLYACVKDSCVINPVFIHSSAKIKSSIIGPYACISANCEIENSIIRDSIINEKATIKDMLLESSIIGEHSIINGKFRTLNIGDFSKIQEA